MDAAIPGTMINGVGGPAPAVTPQPGGGGAPVPVVPGADGNPFGPAIIVSLTAEGQDALMGQRVQGWDNALRLVADAYRPLTGPALASDAAGGGTAMLGKLRTLLGDGGTRGLVRAVTEQEISPLATGAQAMAPRLMPASEAGAGMNPGTTAGAWMLAGLRAIFGEAETRQLIRLLATQGEARPPTPPETPPPAALPSPEDGQHSALLQGEQRPAVLLPDGQRPTILPPDDQPAAPAASEAGRVLIQRLATHWDAVLALISQAQSRQGDTPRALPPLIDTSRTASGPALLAALRATLGEADTRQIIRLLWEQDARATPAQDDEQARAAARPSALLLENARDGLQIHYRPEDQRLVILNYGQDVTATILNGALLAGPAILAGMWPTMWRRFPATSSLFRRTLKPAASPNLDEMMKLLLLAGGIMVVGLFYIALH